MTKIFFWDKQGDKSVVFKFQGDTVTEKTLERGESFPEDYALLLPNDVLVDLHQALTKKLDNMGIRSETEEKLAGKLEATNYHLEDLRTLLKLKQ